MDLYPVCRSSKSFIRISKVRAHAKRRHAVRDRSCVWTNVIAIVLVWTAVVTLALAGLTTISVKGDLGALMLVAALIIAAPAAAMSQQRNSV